MATAKITIHKRKNKDGSHPLMLRLTKNRRSTYVFFDKTIMEKDWDAKAQEAKRTHPNAKRLNAYLLKLRTKAQDTILDFENKDKTYSLDDLKTALNLDRPSNTVFAFASEYFTLLKEAGKYNRLTAERPAISHLKRFLKNRDMAFSEMTIKLLERFDVYLSAKVKVSPRTKANYLIILRSLYKRAIKEGIADKQDYPFGQDKFKIKKPDSQKIGLNEAEVRRIEALVLTSGDFIHHTRNIWLYSFYFAGMRVSDVLLSRWSDFQDGRLFYIMGKNEKPGSLKIPAKAVVILEQYRDQKRYADDLVFPDLKLIEDFSDRNRVERRLKEVIRRLNKALKTIAEQAEIDKPLTMHIARHTFGNLSGDRIPIQMLQKLYRHSSITTTINYQKNFMHREADDALDKVLDF